MHVYTVNQYISHEGHYLCSVWSTRELAVDEWQRLSDKEKHADTPYCVDEMELDSRNGY